MTQITVAKHITDKTKISTAIAEAKLSKATEGITKVGIKFKKLLNILILM